MKNYIKLNNLKNLTEIDKDQARLIRVAGGKASQAKRKQKKEIKEQLELAVEVYGDLKAKDLKAKGHTIKSEIVKKVGVLGFELFEMLRDKTTDKRTKLSIISEILDRTEGKAVQKSSIDLNKFESLSDEDSEIIQAAVKKEAIKIIEVN